MKHLRPGGDAFIETGHSGRWTVAQEKAVFDSVMRGRRW